MVKSSTVLLLLFLISFVSISYSQTYSAKLLDLKKQPIEGVKVFYDNSTIAVYTNAYGKFEIPNLKELPYPILVFYHPSFQIKAISDLETMKSTYYLKKKMEQEKPPNFAPVFERKAMDRAFFENFIGDYRKDKSTKILNNAAIDLRYNPINNTLKAFAAQPIEIQNNNLGYRINYHLEDFEVEFSADTLHRDFIDYSFFHGFSHIEDVDSSRTKERAKLYESTLNHFFRQMIDQNFNDTKFRVVLYDDYKVRLKKLFDVTEQDNGLSKLQLKKEIVGYNDEKEFYLNAKFYYQKQILAIIDMYKPYILIDDYGNIVNTKDITLDSKFLNVKWANRLPVDYRYE